jgi:hypothetical protein
LVIDKHDANADPTAMTQERQDLLGAPWTFFVATEKRDHGSFTDSDGAYRILPDTALSGGYSGSADIRTVAIQNWGAAQRSLRRTPNQFAVAVLRVLGRPPRAPRQSVDVVVAVHPAAPVQFVCNP